MAVKEYTWSAEDYGMREHPTGGWIKAADYHEMVGKFLEYHNEDKARIAALERVVARHVKWRDKALRYLCMVRNREPGYRPLIENFIDDSTAAMIGSTDSGEGEHG